MSRVHPCRRERRGNGYASEKFPGGGARPAGPGLTACSGGGSSFCKDKEKEEAERSLLGAQVGQFTDLGFAPEDVTFVAMEGALGLQRSPEPLPGTV